MACPFRRTANNQIYNRKERGERGDVTQFVISHGSHKLSPEFDFWVKDYTI
jgi:hypothetical protein